MQTVKKLIAVLFCISFSFVSFAQAALPFGYRNVKLGMTVDEVKDALKKDLQFGYRGDRDVSLLPGEQRVLIETDTSRTAPYSFLDRCYFQFYEDKLYTITINLKTEKMDHYSIFTTLNSKYGRPVRFNPELSEWSDEKVIMTLERPLTLKYVDKKVFEQIQNESRVRETAEELSREQFLDSL